MPCPDPLFLENVKVYFLDSNRKLIKFLERNSIDPIVCELCHKAFWDNGVHCMTQDLYREGEKDDYFN